MAAHKQADHKFPMLLHAPHHHRKPDLKEMNKSSWNRAGLDEEDNLESARLTHRRESKDEEDRWKQWDVPSTRRRVPGRSTLWLPGDNGEWEYRDAEKKGGKGDTKSSVLEEIYGLDNLEMMIPQLS